MPSLHRMWKEKVLNHHHEVPYKVLEKQYTFGDEKNENKIIHGDNLEALKSLLPQYEGKIKCIYIDPPYNTWNEGWVYNDNVSHPKIKKWLHQVVGKEWEDLSRHDKWLCMMYPRLKLLHKLLREDWIIVVHIDEFEVNAFHYLLSEIFWWLNNVWTIIRDKKNPKWDSKWIAIQHEYILIYSKDKKLIWDIKRPKKNAKKILDKAKNLLKNIWKKQLPEDIQEIIKKYKLDKKSFSSFEEEIDINKINELFWKRISKQDFSWWEKAYKFIDNNWDVYRNVSMARPNKDKAPDDYFIPLIHPVTLKTCPIPDRWRRNPSETMKQLLEKWLIVFWLDENKQPERKYLLKENMTENVSSIIWFWWSDDDFQKTIWIKFENPKPYELSKEIIWRFTDDNSTILDSFAWSGTTAHAVLNLNKQDGGNRSFVLIEMEDYADNITAERVKRVINGYGEWKKKVEGVWWGFSYYELGQSLFLDEENLNEAVGEDKLREYIWYTETKTPFTEPKKKNKYFLGTNHDADFYFFYEKDKATTLNHEFLSSLETKKNKQFVIYADMCLLSEEFMRKHNIIFKKIPRDITRF